MNFRVEWLEPAKRAQMVSEVSAICLAQIDTYAPVYSDEHLLAAVMVVAHRYGIYHSREREQYNELCHYARIDIKLAIGRLASLARTEAARLRVRQLRNETAARATRTEQWLKTI